MPGPSRLPLLPEIAPWYAEGIRFECQRSGKCCTNHGEYSYVYLTAEDEQRLAAHFDLPLREFRKRHTWRVEGLRTLKSSADACVFLAGRDCQVHAAKPSQCRSWPFWTDNLDQVVWNTEIAPFCDGVGKGRLYTREEIEALAARAGEPD